MQRRKIPESIVVVGEAHTITYQTVVGSAQDAVVYNSGLYIYRRSSCVCE